MDIASRIGKSVSKAIHKIRKQPKLNKSGNGARLEQKAKKMSVLKKFLIHALKREKRQEKSLGFYNLQSKRCHGNETYTNERTMLAKESKSNTQNGDEKSAMRIADHTNRNKISTDGMETPKRSIRTNCRRRICSEPDTFQERPKLRRSRRADERIVVGDSSHCESCRRARLRSYCMATNHQVTQQTSLSEIERILDSQLRGEVKRKFRHERSQSSKGYTSVGMFDRRRRPLQVDDIEFWELENDVGHGFSLSRTSLGVERGRPDGSSPFVDVLNLGYIDADTSKARQHDNASFYVNIDSFISKDANDTDVTNWGQLTLDDIEYWSRFLWADEKAISTCYPEGDGRTNVGYLREFDDVILNRAYVDTSSGSEVSSNIEIEQVSYV
ncbi:hypothetical protein DPMN_144165 [Dreissena polymorpha]|uniref:Uncharacterized protein n=1 Tax=Dreissena polymorpha TaxID=45954 RepID=A0A9D4GEX7_DREPO|nr:hypothetical protein DPMN_144165 [Dreissena polymorpha]